MYVCMYVSVYMYAGHLLIHQHASVSMTSKLLVYVLIACIKKS